MDSGALILLLVVLVLTVLFVARPSRESQPGRARPDQATSALLAERERLLDALSELDFDNSLAKIPSGEYEAQRALLLTDAARVLQALDERHVNPLPATGKTARQARPAGDPPSDEELEDLIARRRGQRRQKAGGFCPHCGKAVLQADRFCPSCGQPIQSTLS